MSLLILRTWKYATQQVYSQYRSSRHVLHLHGHIFTPYISQQVSMLHHTATQRPTCPLQTLGDNGKEDLPSKQEEATGRIRLEEGQPSAMIGWGMKQKRSPKSQSAINHDLVLLYTHASPRHLVVGFWKLWYSVLKRLQCISHSLSFFYIDINVLKYNQIRATLAQNPQFIYKLNVVTLQKPLLCASCATNLGIIEKSSSYYSLCSSPTEQWAARLRTQGRESPLESKQTPN